MSNIVAITEFQSWFQLIFSLTSFVALLSIWLRTDRKDKGFLWLALSILVWFTIAIVYAYFDYNTDNTLLKKWEAVLSIINSFCILWSLPWFKHIPGWLIKLIKFEYYEWIVLVLCLFALFVQISDSSYKPDIYLGIITIILLGSILVYTFNFRELKVLAILTLLVMIVTFLAQILKEGSIIFGIKIPLEPNQIKWLKKLSSQLFQTIWITLFFALAFSWLKEELEEKLKKDVNNNVDSDARGNSENQSQQAQITLFFLKTKISGGDNFFVLITIPELLEKKLIKYTEAPFKLLVKFANQIKTAENRGWIINQREKEFKTNELDRTIHPIAECLIGRKYIGNENLHKETFKELKQALFDIPGNTKYKLKVEAENIDSNFDMGTF